MLGVKRHEVTLEPHNNNWILEYKTTKKNILNILGKNVINIHHIGSTAIKGIVAKPILDIGVSVKLFENINIKGMQNTTI